MEAAIASRMSWPLVKIDSYDDREESRYYADGNELEDVKSVEKVSTRSSATEEPQVIGSSNIFDEYGNIKLIPVCAIGFEFRSVLCAER